MKHIGDITRKVIRDAALARCCPGVKIIDEGKSDCDAHQDTTAAVVAGEVTSARGTLVLSADSESAIRSAKKIKF